MGFELLLTATSSARHVEFQHAEIGFGFFSGEAGIQATVIDKQATYTGGWLKQIKQYKKLVISAAGAARRAAEWIRGERGAKG